MARAVLEELTLLLLLLVLASAAARDLSQLNPAAAPVAPDALVHSATEPEAPTAVAAVPLTGSAIQAIPVVLNPVPDVAADDPYSVNQAPQTAAAAADTGPIAMAAPMTYPYVRVQAASSAGCAKACTSYYGASGVVVNGGSTGQAVCFVEYKASSKYYEVAGLEKRDSTPSGSTVLGCWYSKGDGYKYYRLYNQVPGYSCACTTTTCGSYVSTCNNYFWGFSTCNCKAGCVCRVYYQNAWHVGWRGYDGYYTSNGRCNTPTYTFPSSFAISMFRYCLPPAPVPV